MKSIKTLIYNVLNVCKKRGNQAPTLGFVDKLGLKIKTTMFVIQLGERLRTKPILNPNLMIKPE